MTIANDAIGSVKFRSRSYGGAPWSEGTYTWKSLTSQIASVNHYPLNTEGDDGGPFLLIKGTDSPSFAEISTKLFEGPVSCSPYPTTGSQLGAFGSPSDTEVISNGTTGIARSIPTNPAFDLATALGELHEDGLPALVSGIGSLRNRAAAARNAGGNYLNVEFGWKPLLSDVQSFARAVKSSNQLLSEYRANGNRKTRVAYDGDQQDEHLALTAGVSTRPSQANLTGTGYYSVMRRKRWWFRGAFKYHIPLSNSAADKFHRWTQYADHLLGVKVTPETLWNIAPWSWAVDWFTNTGDVLTNISRIGSDGLVLQYGYSMAETLYETRMVGIFPNPSFSVTRTTTSKYCRRMAATPYGFGTSWSSLSARQLAIIGALGLTHT